MMQRPIFITTAEFCALSRMAPATEETCARKPERRHKLPAFETLKNTKKRVYRIANVAAWLSVTPTEIYIALGFQAAAVSTPAAQTIIPAIPKTRGRKSNAAKADPARCTKTVDFIDATGV